MGRSSSTMATSTECPVCCNKFSKQLRKSVKCAYCNFEACRVCTSRYLLDKCVEPACMNCKRNWSVDFLQQSFTKTWVLTDWRAHTTKMLIEREKSMLPQTQEERMPGFRMYRNNLKIMTQLQAHARKVRAELVELERQEMVLRRQNRILAETGYQTSERDRGGGGGGADNGDSSGRPKTQRFYFGCPVEGCRGLVDASWKCGVCTTMVCDKCRTVITKDTKNDHVCNAEDVATFDLLKRDTKPCPKCHAPVTKMGGCDQMWCTACNNAFSWTTLQPITSGPIHNPYYFEFLASQARAGRVDDYGNAINPLEAEERACHPDGREAMRLPHGFVLRQAMQHARFILPQDLLSEFMALCQRIGHLNHAVLPVHRHTITYSERDHWYERLRFLNNEISEEEFRNVLYLEDRQKLKSSEYTMILETFLLATAPPTHNAIMRLAAENCTQQEGTALVRTAVETAAATRDFCDAAIHQLNYRWNSRLATIKNA